MCLRFSEKNNEVKIQKHINTYMGYKWLTVGYLYDNLVKLQYPLEFDDMSCINMFIENQQRYIA